VAGWLVDALLRGTTKSTGAGGPAGLVSSVTSTIAIATPIIIKVNNWQEIWDAFIERISKASFILLLLPVGRSIELCSRLVPCTSYIPFQEHRSLLCPVVQQFYLVGYFLEKWNGRWTFRSFSLAFVSHWKRYEMAKVEWQSLTSIYHLTDLHVVVVNDRFFRNKNNIWPHRFSVSWCSLSIWIL